jgi:hypothetical protein
MSVDTARMKVPLRAVANRIPADLSTSVGAHPVITVIQGHPVPGCLLMKAITR